MRNCNLLFIIGTTTVKTILTDF